jgi:hypothetical protein
VTRLTRCVDNQQQLMGVLLTSHHAVCIRATRHCEHVALHQAADIAPAQAAIDRQHLQGVCTCLVTICNRHAFLPKASSGSGFLYKPCVQQDAPAAAVAATCGAGTPRALGHQRCV